MKMPTLFLILAALVALAATIFVPRTPAVADDPVGVKAVDLEPTGNFDPFFLDAEGRVKLKINSGPAGQNLVTVEYRVEAPCQAQWIVGDEQPQRFFALYMIVGVPGTPGYEMHRLQSFNTDCWTDIHESFAWLSEANGFDRQVLFSDEVTFAVALELDDGYDSDSVSWLLVGGLLGAGS